jgi:hypothetical protein
VWLSIHEEEKDALLDVLGFLYNSSFKSHEFDHLLKVLLLSDKVRHNEVVGVVVARAADLFSPAGHSTIFR